MALDSLAPLLSRRLPDFRVDTMLDVGAYVGEGALLAMQMFEDASIHCMEPAPDIFRQLRSNLQAYPSATAHQIGISATGGKMPLVIDRNGKGSRIVATGKPGDIEVEVVSGDSFIEAHSIGKVDFLRIDTEGHDLEVLKGFRQTLASGNVSLLEIEAGLHYSNKRHVSLEQLKGFLEPMEYFLFALYQPRYDKKPLLKRCTAAFVSQTLFA